MGGGIDKRAANIPQYHTRQSVHIFFRFRPNELKHVLQIDLSLCQRWKLIS